LSAAGVARPCGGERYYRPFATAVISLNIFSDVFLGTPSILIFIIIGSALIDDQVAIAGRSEERLLGLICLIVRPLSTLTAFFCLVYSFLLFCLNPKKRLFSPS
jgi:hypothetical protein